MQILRILFAGNMQILRTLVTSEKWLIAIFRM